jgi:hypothetical protein
MELDKRINNFELAMERFEKDEVSLTDEKRLDLAEKEMREIGKLMYRKGLNDG